MYRNICGRHCTFVICSLLTLSFGCVSLELPKDFHKCANQQCLCLSQMLLGAFKNQRIAMFSDVYWQKVTE